MEGVKMHSLVYLAVMLLYAGSAPAQVHNHATIDEAKTAIKASNQLYFKAFAKNDSALFISLYAVDCWIMPPNAPALCGPAAPGDFFKTAYNTSGIRNGRLITIDVYGIAGDIVAETGFWKVYSAGNAELDDGKFMVLWKKTPKGWKMWRDIFNSSRSKQ